MHIPTHQIHNVLNAYAKRLKKMHDAGNNAPDDAAVDPINAYSVEEKRRMIINKISGDIIDRIARSQPRPRPARSKISHNDPSPARNDSGSEPGIPLLRYHILTKNGEKISARMKILDSDYLIRQLEEIARKSPEG